MHVKLVDILADDYADEEDPPAAAAIAYANTHGLDCADVSGEWSDDACSSIMLTILQDE